MKAIDRKVIDEKTLWVLRYDTGYRFVGTKAECDKRLQYDKEEIKDYDVAAKQPAEVEEFWKALWDYEDKNHKFMYIDDFYPIYVDMCNAGKEPKILKAISVSVYKNADGRDCTNGGVSSRYKEVLILHTEGWIDVDINNPPENLLNVSKIKVGDKVYKHLEPIKESKMCGWMFGGNYAATSDSRFSDISDYPLPIHDREESQELYNMLSND